MRQIKMRYWDEGGEIAEKTIADEHVNWSAHDSRLVCIWRGSPYLYNATWALVILADYLISLEMADL